jgi:hypothetical protein
MKIHPWSARARVAASFAIMPVALMIVSCASQPPAAATPASMPAASQEMPTIAIDAQFVAAVRSGEKRMTVRSGRRTYPIGPAIMKSPTETIPIQITALEYKAFSELTDEDAKADGATDAADLRKGLLVFYPNLKAADPVTIVRFRTR